MNARRTHLAAAARAAVLAAVVAVRAAPAAAQAQEAPPPARFERVTTIGGAVTGIVVEGARAYVSRGERVDVYDIGGPAPRPLGSSAPLGGVATVHDVAGTRLVASVRRGFGDAAEAQLVVLDVSGAQPAVAGELGAAVEGSAVAWEFGMAVVGARGVFFIPGPCDDCDVERPAELRLYDLGAFPVVETTSYALPAPPTDLALVDDWLVVSHDDGLMVLDVRAPLAPVAAGELALPWTRAVALRGSTALVLAPGGLHTVDLTDPHRPAVIATPRPVGGSDVVVDGRAAWLVDRSWRYPATGGVVHQIDLDDPAVAPAGFEVPDLRAAAAVDGRLIVAQGRHGLQTLAVVDGRDRYLESRWQARTVGAVAGLAVAGGLAVVTDADREVWTWDAARPAAPQPLGRVDAPGDDEAASDATAGGVAVHGGLAYVSTLGDPSGLGSSGGVTVVDIADPRAPAVVGGWATYDMPAAEENAVRSYALPTNPYGPAVAGGRLYLSGDTVPLTVLDVADPTAPAWRGRFGGGDAYLEAGGFALDGARAWLALRTEGVGLLDLARPASIALVDQVRLPGVTNDVARVGGTVLALTEVDDGVTRVGRAWVIDAASRTRGAAVTGVPGRRAAADGARFHLTDAGALATLDLADPDAPRIVAQLALDGGRPGDAPVVGRVGDVLWVGDGDLGLSIVRLVEGAAPRAPLYLPVAWSPRR